MGQKRYKSIPFSPRDVLDEILDLPESVSEGFPTYSCNQLGSYEFSIVCEFAFEGYIHL